MEGVTSNKRKMKELEDNLLYRLTSTKVSFSLDLHTILVSQECLLILFVSCKV